MNANNLCVLVCAIVSNVARVLFICAGIVSNRKNYSMFCAMIYEHMYVYVYSVVLLAFDTLEME